MDIAQLRLTNQHLYGKKYNSPEEVVRNLGAIQAQDYGQSLWAIGVRMSHAHVCDIEKALQQGKIIRTWVMRGTLHYILPENARWMLKLLATRVMARLTPKIWQYHGMDEKMMTLAQKTFVKALGGGKTLTRATLIELLKNVGIPNDKQQSYFSLGYLCQTGVLCAGPPQGKEQTFVLLDEWAPNQRKLSYEESLSELAQMFFTSHGPATVADLANWSGLKISEAKLGFESVKKKFVKETIEGDEYWMPPDLEPGKGIFLLPGYDEFLIGYKDRFASFKKYGPVHISTYNGMFFATIIEDGQVAGLWKRVLKKNSLDIELYPLGKLDERKIKEQSDGIGKFLGLPARITIRTGLPTDSQPRSFKEKKKSA